MNTHPVDSHHTRAPSLDSGSVRNQLLRAANFARNPLMQAVNSEDTQRTHAAQALVLLPAHRESAVVVADADAVEK